MEHGKLKLLTQVAEGIAAQFGKDCEVVIHDLDAEPEHSIVFVANGHVSGRKVGDGASKGFLEQIKGNDSEIRDHLSYMMKTPNGKILKSSTIYLRDDDGRVSAILAINYDVSKLVMLDGVLHDLVSTEEPFQTEHEKSVNVNDLLDELIQQSVELVGKPVPLMNKDDKVKAIQFLNQRGAFLVMKSGDKVAKYFGISKYTLYSYIDFKGHSESKER